ncbi:MAG: restriction endonuclease subunit S [Candidatus Nanopelagicales bacterium]
MSKTDSSKSGTVVAFGDVVRLSKERSKDPAADGFERYIGLEHLSPDDMRVRTWGDIDDGTTFTNVFRPGQVLFGKRRAYQRKVAVADFAGVCSSDIYVLEPQDDRLLPELLPFLCQSEPFYDYVISMSQGGLSPRVNWKALAKYEFALPPIADQRRVGEALRSATCVVEALREVEEWSVTLRDRLIVDLIEQGLGGQKTSTGPIGRFPAHWEICPIGDRYEIRLGKMVSAGAKQIGDLTPYLRNANVQWNRLDLDDVAFMRFSDEERMKLRLEWGDILACEGRHVGKSAIWRGEIAGACYQKALHRLRARSDRDHPEYMLHCLRYFSVSGRFTAEVGETTIPHLAAVRFKAMLFPFPSKSEQVEIGDMIEDFDSGVLDIGLRRAAAQDLRAACFHAGMRRS